MRKTCSLWLHLFSIYCIFVISFKDFRRGEPAWSCGGGGYPRAPPPSEWIAEDMGLITVLCASLYRNVLQTLVWEFNLLILIYSWPCILTTTSDIYKYVKPHVLSFIGATVLVGSSVVDGTGQIVLDDLLCTGNESKLINCPHNGLGNHNCNHSDDAGIRCAPGILHNNYTLFQRFVCNL